MLFLYPLADMLKISSKESGAVTIHCTSIKSKNKLENTKVFQHSCFLFRIDLVAFPKIQRNSKALELHIGILGNLNKSSRKPQTGDGGEALS